MHAERARIEPARIPDHLGRGGRAGRGQARGPAASTAPRRPRQSDLTDAVLAAFRARRLVALGEVHFLQEHHDLLQTLLSDPRLPRVVDDIVVEFGARCTRT